MNVTAYNHLKGISRRNRHRYKTLICFTAFSPLKSNAFYFNLRNYFAIAYLSLSVYINIQFVGVNWFTENSERDWLMSSIGTFWLANALGERRAIAERHSTEVECLKNCNATAGIRTRVLWFTRPVLYRTNLSGFPPAESVLSDWFVQTSGGSRISEKGGARFFFFLLSTERGG